jgi:hypothetical protein
MSLLKPPNEFNIPNSVMNGYTNRNCAEVESHEIKYIFIMVAYVYTIWKYMNDIMTDVFHEYSCIFGRYLKLDLKYKKKKDNFFTEPKF